MNKRTFYKNQKLAVALIISTTLIFSYATAAFATVEATPDAPTSTAVSAPVESQSDPATPSSTNPEEGVSSASPNPNSSSASSNTASQASSSSKNSSKIQTHNSSGIFKPSRPSVSVNTNKAEIDQRASRAAAAVSDPDVLSSQSWEELLTSEAVSGNTSGGLFNNQAMDKDNSRSGGFPWLLIAGAAMIIASLVGIGYFIFSQFFADEDLAPIKKGAPHKSRDTQEIQKFTDISSDSSGTQLREDYIPPKEAVYEDMKRKKATKNQRPLPQSVQKTAAAKPAPQKPGKQTSKAGTPHKVDSVAKTNSVPPMKPNPAPQKQTPSAPSSKLPKNPAGTLSPKAQAQPVEQTNPKNFDWEKFFDENPKRK